MRCARDLTHPCWLSGWRKDQGSPPQNGKGPQKTASKKTETSLSFLKLIFIGVWLIYNVVLVSAVQQSESVIHIHISTLFQILFPSRSLQSIEQSSLCYTVGSYWLSILHIVVCLCQSQSPSLSPSFPPGNHKFVFYICNSISVL